MSNIKLAPNASGTGSLTIAAPNTNNTLTMNLPDTLGSAGASAFATTDANGNLGVGTTSPTNTAGYQTIEVNGSSGGIVRASYSTSVKGYYFANSAGVTLGSESNDVLMFRTNATERARIDTSGNLLVGTTTASGRLSIDSAGTTSATYIIFGRNSATTNKFTVRSDGAGFLDAAAWTYGSDATIKENIEYLEPSNCLSLILNAKPAKFDYIDGQKSNYGYIAQDVQTWLPEAVSENPNGKLGLQDGFINAVGTGAIQALNQIIQELKAEVDNLKAQLKGA